MCGATPPDGSELCAYHPAVTYADAEWSRGNRVMCDFFHRGVVPPRLAPPERSDDFWSYSGSDA